jgi:hypothetical protein
MVKRRAAVGWQVGWEAGTANARSSGSPGWPSAWDDAYARWLSSRDGGALQMPAEDVLEVSFAELLPVDP